MNTPKAKDPHEAPDGRGRRPAKKPLPAFSDRVRRLGRVRLALRRRYGEPPPPAVTHPVEYAIRTILAEEATAEQVERAVERLRRDFVDWNDLRVSRPREVRDALGPDFPRSGYKARVIPRLLDQVFKDHNSMVWDFFEAMGKVRTRAYFEKLEDVRPFLAATLARDCAGAHAFPVDNDIARVLGRLGIIEVGEGTEAALQAFLERAVKSSRILQAHQLLRRLAEDVCTVEGPACVRCVVAAVCPSREVRPRPSPKRRAAAKRPAGAKGGAASKKAARAKAGARPRAARPRPGRPKRRRGTPERPS
jgi:endonuclease-3